MSRRSLNVAKPHSGLLLSIRPRTAEETLPLQVRQSAPRRSVKSFQTWSVNEDETSRTHEPVVTKALLELVSLLLRVVARSGNEAGVRGKALKRADDLVDIGVQAPENDSYGLL